MQKIIVTGSDHAGFELKEVLKKELEAKGIKVLDVGTHSTESCDYPDFGYKVADKIAHGEAGMGLIICGTGIGISIAANRDRSIRAALCHDEETAKLAREHNNANVLALGARVINQETAKKCLDIFINTEFKGGRHEKRVEKLSSKELKPIKEY